MRVGVVELALDIPDRCVQGERVGVAYDPVAGIDGVASQGLDCLGSV